MDDTLFERGRSLEELFFRQRDAELIVQHKQLEQMKETREALTEVSGISNSKVLDRLIEFKVSPSILASLAILPLVEVAWADGNLDEKERKAVLVAATGNGIGKGSVDYDLLETWLKHRPPARLLEAWTHYMSGLCEAMNEEELDVFRSDLLTRARKVAKAAGGFLSLTSKISDEEQSVLKKMEDAFKLQ